MIICPHPPPPLPPLCPPRFLYGLTGSASECTDSKSRPASWLCCARCVSLSPCPLQTHIPQGKRKRERGSERERERERERRSWEKSNETKRGEKNGAATQMALMAGILFTATFLVFGISTFVSPARIYPPNEGKDTGTKQQLPRTCLSAPRVCVRPGAAEPHSLSVLCGCAEPRWETPAVTFYAASSLSCERDWDERCPGGHGSCQLPERTGWEQGFTCSPRSLLGEKVKPMCVRREVASPYTDREKR